MNRLDVKKIVIMGILAGLSYVVFTFLQIKITLPFGDKTSLHLGNAVVVLGALLIGGFEGGFAGAIGMTIGDLFDPVYIAYAPKTFICKLGIGLVTGFFAYKVFKIQDVKNKKALWKYVILSSSFGMLFNVIFDPLIGYGYKILIIGKPLADVVLKYNIIATSINAVLSVIVASIVYVYTRERLSESNIGIVRIK